MNHRQTTLQSIIKQQEGKILQLREELELVTQLSEARVLDERGRCLEVVREKEEMIEMLRQELEKQRSVRKDKQQFRQQFQATITKNQRLQQQLTHYRQLSTSQQSHITQLQSKLSTLTQSHSRQLSQLTTQLTNLRQQNSTLQQATLHSTQSLRLFQQQMQKLTRFYKQTMFEVPKKKETLLWVDNLIKFMEVAQKSGEKRWGELWLGVKKEVEGLRVEMMKCVGECAVMEEKLSVQCGQTMSQLSSLIKQFAQSCQFLTTQLTQLSQSNQKQTLLSLQSQLTTTKHLLQSTNQSHTVTIITLQHRIKQLQTSNKSLVIGFTQLKTYIQSKQATFRQQSSMLKSTINELIEGSELRQKQFEEELRLVGQQVEAVSVRYYENIEVPVQKMSRRVERELERVKEELARFKGDEKFVREVNRLGDRLQGLGEGDVQEYKAMEVCMKKGNELLITIRQLVTQMLQKKQQRQSLARSSNSNNSGVLQLGLTTKPLFKQSPKVKQPHNPQSPPLQLQPLQLQQISQLSQAVSLITQKQRQHKHHYQLNLLKKQNHKLTQHINLLQKKIRNLASNKFIDEKALTNYFRTQRKIIELETQCEQRKQLNLEYEKLMKQQTQKMYRKIQEVKKQYKETSVEQSSILEALGQLRERHEIIQELLKQRNQKMIGVQEGMKIINDMLVRPSETFEALVREVAQQLAAVAVVGGRVGLGGGVNGVSVENTQSYYLSNMSININPLTPTKNLNPYTSTHPNQYPSTYRSRFSINQSTIKEYQQLITKRSQITNSGNKLLAELIKTLREQFPTMREYNKRKEEAGEKENAMGKTMNKVGNKQPSVEKKIKDLQGYQQKLKSELLAKLQLVSKQLASIQAKQTKIIASQAKQNKLDSIIDKGCARLLQQIKQHTSQQLAQHKSLCNEAFKDTKSKLQQSVKESQGLRREMELMMMAVKGEKGKVRNGVNFFEDEREQE